jgi:hypothetical protein
MSKLPAAPYPPDLADEEPAATGQFGDLVDAVVTDADWANERAQRWSAQDRPRGHSPCQARAGRLSRLPHAALFATALGIEITEALSE